VSEQRLGHDDLVVGGSPVQAIEQAADHDPGLAGAGIGVEPHDDLGERRLHRIAIELA
jgi:hypothetical protein